MHHASIAIPAALWVLLAAWPGEAAQESGNQNQTRDESPESGYTPNPDTAEDRRDFRMGTDKGSLSIQTDPQTGDRYMEIMPRPMQETGESGLELKPVLEVPITVQPPGQGESEE